MKNLQISNNRLAQLSVSVVLLTSLLGEARADSQYGPLKAGETLSSIVNENYLVSPFEDSVIMKEIFRMNPEAFIYGNIGLVRQGVILTLPSDNTIRQSRGSGAVTQATSRSQQLTQSLEATLAQVRKERDQAVLRTRRVESEAAAQSKSLNSQIKQLESDKSKIAQDLAASLTEKKELEQALEKFQQANNQAVVSAGSSDEVRNTELLKKLDTSNQIVEEKQEQVEKLEAAVLELKSAAAALNASHKLALSDLRAADQSLEDKLASREQIDSKQLVSKLEELKLQHQAELDELQSTHEAESAAKSEATGNLAELKAQHASEIESLSVEHEKAIEDLNASFDSQLAERDKTLETLQSEFDNLQATSGEVIDIEPLLGKPLTKEAVVQHLEKPVAFPFWGLLLGAFALGFTSLMVLFTRKRKEVQMEASGHAADASMVKEAEKEELVFRSGDAVQDPDVEMLRVPPRRDPSRVAILDPTMATTNPASVEDAIAQEATSSTVSSDQEFEAKLKLLIAESYEELDDKNAANEILLEVQEEGTSTQIMAAKTIISRLND